MCLLRSNSGISIKWHHWCMTSVYLMEMSKAITWYSLTGLNIIILHDSFFLIFHTVIIINSKNWRTIKLHFENLSIFFKKNERTHILGPLLPLFIFVCFSMTPTPLLNECTFWMTPLKEVENISLPWYYIYTSFSPQYLPHFSWTLWFSLMVKKTNAAVKTMESGDAP